MMYYVAVLKCDIMKPPFMYLGMTIGGNQSRSSFLEGIVGKFWKILDT